MEHEKYPNCVRLSTVVSVIDDLLVTVDRNTLYIYCIVYVTRIKPKSQLKQNESLFLRKVENAKERQQSKSK